jgi:hypothetical protein
MAATEGVVGKDTQLEIGDGESPEEFTLVPECKDFDGPEVTQEFADFTHQQSPSGFRERKPTFKSSGAVTFKMNRVYEDTQQDLLIDNAMANPTELTNFQLVYPDGETLTFSAYPSVRFNGPMSAAKEIQVTLNLEGAFTRA